MKGRVLAAPSSLVDAHVMVIPAPMKTTRKKMPGRTISEDVRIIFDLRLPNLFCTKSDYPDIAITDLREAAERVIALRRTWPHIKLTCCERVIDASFKRIRVHPDMCIMLCTEFGLEHFGGERSVYLMYLTPPFGWRGIILFGSRGRNHQGSSPVYSSKQDEGGAQNLSSMLYAGDAIFIEPCLGLRPEVTVTCWEHLRRGLLGQDALNAEKLEEEEEGDWKENQILLGFEVGVNSLRIALPTPKIAHASEVIDRDVFTHGNRIIPVRKVKEWRGLVNHWGYARRFWKYRDGPINSLLRFSDITGTWVRCDNDQVWISLRNLVQLMRSISGMEEMWKELEFHQI